ncbi:hypothetical protein DPMN_066428 [Dreissena polymorpha]|uniref:Uncharacterized protein n=1 Tax=Dreissena polymorpha TaxID=45954 RepID=A0A9D3YWB3_DREPO|nr:hypothetical protein DPMN_066428 [Dreissena polymorpha]
MCQQTKNMWNVIVSVDGIGSLIKGQIRDYVSLQEADEQKDEENNDGCGNID